MQKQLTTRQICLFFLSFSFLNKLFTMPSILASVSKNDLWLSALFCVILDSITLFALIMLTKNTDKDLYAILETNLSKKFSKVVCSIYAVVLFIKSYVPIIEHKEYLDLTLYTSNPSILYFLPFFITLIYLCSKKLRILGRLSDMLFLSTILGFVLLMTLSIPHSDFSNVLPVGVNKARKIITGSFLSLTWFGDCIYFLFFIGNYKKTKNYKAKIIICYLISAVFIILFLIVFYGIFTSIAFRQKFSLTEISKYTTIINSTGRFDFFAILLLLISNIVTICTPLFFCCKLLEYVFGLENRYIIPLIISLILITLSVTLKEHIYSIQKILITTAGYLYLFFLNVLPTLIVAINHKGEKNEVD